MIIDMASYIGAIDLSASGATEIVYPFQLRLGIDVRTLLAIQSESYSDLKNAVFQRANEATDNMAILFVLSQAESRSISTGIEAIGQISRSKNILTIGIFSGEVFERNKNAMRSYNSTFLLNSSPDSDWVSDATSIIRGISDTIVIPGLVGIDLADIKAVLHDAGETLMGTGTGQGPDRTIIAAKSALRHISSQSPDFSSASSILVSAVDGIQANIVEFERALQIIGGAFKNNPEIMASLIRDDQIQENFTIKIFAGGFPHYNLRQLSGTRP